MFPLTSARAVHAKRVSAKSQNNGGPRGDKFYRRRRLSNQRKMVFLEGLFGMGDRFYNFFRIQCRILAKNLSQETGDSSGDVAVYFQILHTMAATVIMSGKPHNWHATGEENSLQKKTKGKRISSNKQGISTLSATG